MKHSEPDYLDTLFALSSDESDAAQGGFPLVDVPDTLNRRLTAIVHLVPASGDSFPASGALPPAAPAKPHILASWPTATSIAATLLVTLVGFQFYQQQQTLNQLEQAQADLTTALHYLGEANRITRAQVVNSLNETVGEEMINARANARTNAKTWLEPYEPEIKTPNRSL